MIIVGLGLIQLVTSIAGVWVVLGVGLGHYLWKGLILPDWLLIPGLLLLAVARACSLYGDRIVQRNKSLVGRPRDR